MTRCVLCGREGTRGFVVVSGDPYGSGTAQWRCANANRGACERRQSADPLPAQADPLRCSVCSDLIDGEPFAVLFAAWTRAAAEEQTVCTPDCADCVLDQWRDYIQGKITRHPVEGP